MRAFWQSEHTYRFWICAIFELLILLLLISCKKSDKTSFGNAKEFLKSNDENKDEKSSLIFDSVIFGKYEQDNVIDNGKEDIEWYVIDENAESKLLMSKYVIDILPYDATSLNDNTYDGEKKCNWESSYVRKWLNDTFYQNAFDELEKDKIISSGVENGVVYGVDNLTEPMDMGPKTSDFVFILSKEEMRKYFGFEKNNQNANYISSYTKYASEKNRNLENSNFDINFAIWHTERKYDKKYENNAEYLLRSPTKKTKVSDVEYTSLIVGKDGHIANRTFPYYVYDENKSLGQYYQRGIRPVIRVKKDTDVDFAYQNQIEHATKSDILLNEKANTYSILNILDAKKVISYSENFDIEKFDTIEFGECEQDNNLSNGLEPINWIVLEMDDEKALLLSKYILDIVEYSNVLDKRVLWKNSSLRAYANNEFYQSAFNEREKAFMLPKKNTNYENPVYDSFVDTDTVDKVSILGFDECIKYFNIDYAESTSNAKSNVKMKTYPTVYARDKFLNDERVAIGATDSDFWLRNQGYSGEETPYKINYQMSASNLIDFKGRAYDISEIENEKTYRSNFKLGFRPLILIDLKVVSSSK